MILFTCTNTETRELATIAVTENGYIVAMPAKDESFKTLRGALRYLVGRGFKTDGTRYAEELARKRSFRARDV